jgi:hypothetical protein
MYCAKKHKVNLQNLHEVLGVCKFVCVCVCVCVCVSKSAQDIAYVCMCMCMCMYVCVRECA